jgi:hypothetical protein
MGPNVVFLHYNRGTAQGVRGSTFFLQPQATGTPEQPGGAPQWLIGLPYGIHSFIVISCVRLAELFRLFPGAVIISFPLRRSILPSSTEEHSGFGPVAHEEFLG